MTTTSRPDTEGRMTVVEHLGELRRRLFVSVVAFFVAAVIVYVFSLDIISFLTRAYEQATDGREDALVFLGPTDAFVVRLKVATYGAIVVSSPVWLYQLWRFITPGLNPKERRYALPFVVCGVLLFGVGAVVAMVVLEPALDFLIGMGGSELQPTLAVDRYISMVLFMVIGFGLGFQLPLVLVFLLLVGVITTRQLSKWRRVAILAITIFAAAITPSVDPYSLALLAIPMWVLYETSIIIGKVLKR